MQLWETLHQNGRKGHEVSLLIHNKSSASRILFTALLINVLVCVQWAGVSIPAHQVTLVNQECVAALLREKYLQPKLQVVTIYLQSEA